MNGTLYFIYMLWRPVKFRETQIYRYKPGTMIKVTGYECNIAFVIAMNGIEVVHPNTATHPEFGEALQRAVKAGVKILYLCCNVRHDELNI